LQNIADFAIELRDDVVWRAVADRECVPARDDVVRIDLFAGVRDTDGQEYRESEKDEAGHGKAFRPVGLTIR
jgi:hypothetical protein